MENPSDCSHRSWDIEYDEDKEEHWCRQCNTIMWKNHLWLTETKIGASVAKGEYTIFPDADSALDIGSVIKDALGLSHPISITHIYLLDTSITSFRVRFELSGSNESMFANIETWQSYVMKPTGVLRKVVFDDDGLDEEISNLSK